MIVSFEDIPLHSRVWVFLSSRLLLSNEADEIKEKADDFLSQWTAHRADLKAASTVIDRLFLVVSVDETDVNASGCSIDKLFHFVKSLHEPYSVDFLNRLKVAYCDSNMEIVVSSLNELETKLNAKLVNGELLVYDTTVATVEELQTKFRCSLKETWLNRYLN